MVRPRTFRIETESPAPGTCQITPAGELDMATAPRLLANLEEVLAGDVHHVVINLSKLDFLDSTGLRLFLALQRRASTEDWALTLTSPSETVRSILEITGSGRSLPIVEDWAPS
jgi:anti-anti-sigma factor